MTVKDMNLFVPLALFLLLFCLLIVRRYFRRRIERETQSATPVQSSRFMEWTASVLPPLFLLPLFVTPWDVVVYGYWLIGGIATLVSITTIVKTCWAASTYSPKIPHKGLVRPILTTAIFLFAFGYMWNHSAAILAETDSIARLTAEQMQMSCKSNRGCLDAPAGWESIMGKACQRVDFMRVCYSRSDDHSKFFITAVHRMDDVLIIHGGVLGELKEEHICC